MTQTITPTRRAFILASGSPRRRELTANLGLEPEVVVSDVEEVRAPDESPQQYTERLALEKARDVARKLAGDASEPDWILAADTIVVRDGEVLEKPADEEDARQMLASLSGRAHQVITSFCWLARGEDARHAVRSVSTDVYFRALTEEAIARYVATGEPMDKAGAYGIQGLAGVFVARIDGSYSAVVGLPVAAVIATLEELGGLEGFPFAPR